MKNKLLFAVCFIALFLLSAVSVSAVANVQISFADGTYHKDLPYNHVEDLAYTVTGVYYPVYFNIWTYDQINGGLVETIFVDSTSSPLFNELIGLDTSNYMPGSYEVIIEGYDGDLQQVTNPIQTTFTVENLPYITVYPSNVVLSPTQTQQFGAYGGSAGNEVTDYIWSITGPCSITEQAIVTGNNPGACTITAEDKESPATGTQSLTVIKSSIYIDPAIENAYPNEHKEFSVINGVGPFTWSVSSYCNYDVVDSDTIEVYGSNVDECDIQVFDTVGLGQATATLNIITTDLTIQPAYDTAYPSEQKSYVASGAAGNYIWSVSPENFCDIQTNEDTALVNGTNENINCTVTVTDSLGSGQVQATLEIITSVVNILPEYQIAYPNVEKTYTATGIQGTALWSVTPESVCDINFVGNNAYVSGSNSDVDCIITVVDSFGTGSDTATLDIIANNNLQIYPTPQQAYAGEQKQYTAVNGVGDLTWTVAPSAFCDISSSGITALVNGSNPDFDCDITLTDEAAGYATGLLEVIDSPEITVIPPHSDLFLNSGYNTQEFNAYGGEAGNEPEDYIWEVSDEEYGFFNYIMGMLGLDSDNCMIGESTGILTALQVGDCYVKATDTQSSGFGTATVTVHLMPTVVINPNPSTILVNENELFTATGGFSGDYTWEIISGAAHCEFVTINDDNTLIKGTSEGSCTIKAMDTASGAYATANLYVEENVVFDPLSIMPEVATIYVTESQEFVAYDGEEGYEYEWEIISGQSHCNFVPTNSMDTNIVKGTSVGDCTIQVTRGLESVTALLHVIETPLNLYINPESASIFEGDEQVFTAYEGQTGNYNWDIISGQSHCSFVSISNNEVTIEGTAVGSCLIQVEDSGEIETAILEVVQTPVGLYVLPPSAQVNIGQSQIFSAYDGDTGVYDWSVISGQTHCEITNDFNNQIIVTGTTVGSCQIQAEDNGEFATAVLTVNTEANLEIIPDYAQVNVGESRLFTAVNGESETYYWSFLNGSSHCNIVSISNDEILIKGTSVGSCTLQVEDNGEYATAVLTVNEGIVFDPLSIMPEVATIDVTESQEFVAYDGEEGYEYNWEIISGQSHCNFVPTNSMDTNIVEGTSVGDCTIQVTRGLESVTALLHVIETPLDLYINPESASIFEGDEQVFTAYEGQTGNYNWDIISGQSHCSFVSISNNEVTIEGTAVGSCLIQVEDSGEIETAILEVVQTPVGLYVLPPSAQVNIGQSQIFSAYDGDTGVYDWSVISGQTHCEITNDFNNQIIVTGTTVGSCQIQAEDSGEFATAVLTVNTEANLEIIPDYAQVNVGENQLFTAINGNTETYYWSFLNGSSHCNILSISNDEILIEGTSVGSCTLQVEDNGEYATAVLNVTAPGVLEIIPDYAQVNVGENQLFTAINGNTEIYYWSFLNGSSHCNILSISNDEILIEGTSVGSCTLQVEDNGEYATAVLNVTAPGVLEIIPDYAQVNVGENQLFTAINGNTEIYYWSFLNGSSHCNILSISNDEILIEGTSVGSCTLQVEDNGEYATAVLNVTAPGDLEIIPDYAQVNVGGNQLFTAINGNTEIYYWSFLNGSSHCNILSISNDEILIEGTSVGSCTLQVEDNGEYATAVLNVTNNETLEIIPPYAEIFEGETFTFTAVGGDTNTYYWDIISGQSHCSFVSISNDIITVMGTSVGSCTLQVEDSGEFATAVLNVTEIVIPDIFVIPPEVNLTIGETQQFTAVGGCDYIWYTTGACSINQSGYLWTNAVGQCTVTAYDVCSTGLGSANVTVEEIIVPEILVMPPEVNLTIGETQQFTATGGCGYDWSVTGACAINQFGFLVANAVGQCTVIAEDQCSAGIGSANVTIEDLVIPVIKVTPESVTLDIGEHQQYTATGGCDYIWSVTGPCSIDQNGLLSSYSIGSCTITATDICGGEFDNAYATIVNASDNPISAEIIASPLSGEKPLYVSFEGLGTGFGQLTYEWDFGYPNYLAYGKYSYHTFHDAGSYPVYLTVTDALGRTATDVEYINVLSHADMNDKPQSRIIVESLVNTNEGNVFCGGMAEFYIRLTNTGSELDDFKIAATIPEAGLYQSLQRFDFEDTVSRFLSIDIPCDVNPGLYTVHFTFSNDELRRTVHRDFIIEG